MGVHPLMPRKPFARLLDSANLLEPILADALCRVSMQPRARRTIFGGEAAEPGSLASPRILLARWGPRGLAARHWSSRAELLGLFFGPRSVGMPRPGDWFCPRCSKRNMSSRF